MTDVANYGPAESCRLTENSRFAGYLIDLTAYFATAVIPCVLPVLLALGLHRELRERILQVS